VTRTAHQMELLKALNWQVESGVFDAVGDTPVDRYALAVAAPPQKPRAVTAEKTPRAPLTAPTGADITVDDAVNHARSLAARCGDLNELKSALAGFESCALKKGARSLVFADGNPAARVMIVGEAPGREEDIQGVPFVGAAGQLLDKMFAAIDLSRAAPDPSKSIYITNVLPWRPPQNRDPRPEETAMMLPFLRRHIALAQPEFLVLMGNAACMALLGYHGITKLRGGWVECENVPTLPMFHPANLLRTPANKRESWSDLLSLQARLKGNH